MRPGLYSEFTVYRLHAKIQIGRAGHEGNKHKRTEESASKTVLEFKGVL